MSKTVEIPMRMPPVVYWYADFNNSPRHCWPNKDGAFFVEGSSFSQICDLKHDLRLAGQVEWMRFIHAVNKIIRMHNQSIDFYSEDFDMSTLGGFGSPKQLGSGMHDAVNIHWPGFEIYNDWIVFVDNKNEEAKIELHNEDLIWIANKAFDMVQAQYER